jgi:hypothetical protein
MADISESSLQAAIVAYIKSLPHPAASLIFAIPNQLDQRLQRKGTLSKRRRMGVKGGAPDLFLAFPASGYHGLFLEVKTPTGTISQNQLECCNKLQVNGYCVVIVRDFNLGVYAINRYLGLDITN